MKNIVLTLLSGTTLLLAQPDVRIVTREAAGGRPMTVDFVGASEMRFGGKAVKGLPYAAEAVSETTQMLADGNRISRKTSSAVYRDSQGRTRDEIAMPSVGPWAAGKAGKMVSIFDPVSKTSIMLHPDKTAVKHAMPHAMDGAQWTETVSGDAHTMIFNKRVEGPGEFRVVEDVVIERRHKLAAEATHIEAAAGVRTRAEGQSLRKESLGRKVIEGVEAEGARTTSTIAAGEIGNERAIEIVDETWYSKELEALVYSRHSDPQNGETTYRLTNIQRGEQPIHLFEVPADFKVMDSGPGKIEFKFRKPANE